MHVSIRRYIVETSVSKRGEEPMVQLNHDFARDVRLAELTRHFTELANSVGPYVTAQARDTLDALIPLLVAYKKPSLMREFHPQARKMVSNLRSGCSDSELCLCGVYLVSCLAAGFASRHVEIGSNLIDTSLERGLLRLKEFLDRRPSTYFFDDEFFIKDLRFAAGLSIPFAGGIVDLFSRLGGTARAGLLRRHPVRFRQLIASEQPVLRMYLDPRRTDTFTEEGVGELLLGAADLLLANPDAIGYTCKSWWHDPAIASLSPHLAHLSQVPVSHGALLFPASTSERDAERALSTSKSRRASYEAGQYKPRAFVLFWPRDEMIAWRRASSVAA